MFVVLSTRQVYEFQFWILKNGSILNCKQMFVLTFRMTQLVIYGYLYNDYDDNGDGGGDKDSLKVKTTKLSSLNYINEKQHTLMAK